MNYCNFFGVCSFLRLICTNFIWNENLFVDLAVIHTKRFFKNFLLYWIFNGFSKWPILLLLGIALNEKEGAWDCSYCSIEARNGSYFLILSIIWNLKIIWGLVWASDTRDSRETQTQRFQRAFQGKSHKSKKFYLKNVFSKYFFLNFPEISDFKSHSNLNFFSPQILIKEANPI